MKQVIIPSAGRATRFGGTLKELLPINETETPMFRAIQNAVLGMNADEIVLITSTEKISEHVKYIDKNIPYGIPISYRIQNNAQDLWGAILTGIDWNSDGGLVMPDTVTFINPEYTTAPIAFGVFWTQEPNRFSILSNGTIYTKRPILDDIRVHSKAWGTVEWGVEVAQYWQQTDEYAHYDDAFRDAMERFGYATYDLPYYYDLGSFKAYTDYIKENK